MNAWFKEHPRRLYTWKSPGDRSRNQIDYISINHRFKRAVKLAKTYPGADCGSDHVPVICTLQCKPKKLKKARTTKKLDFEQWKAPEIRLAYSIKVENMFEQLIDEGDQITLESMKNILVETAEECVPQKERRSKNKWMTQEILSMMTDRQKIKNRDSQEYRDADKLIKKKCREAKETWLDRECKEIEDQFGVSHKLYQKFNEISGRRLGCSGSGCINAKDGTMLVEKNDIKNRWIECIGELFHDT